MMSYLACLIDKLDVGSPVQNITILINVSEECTLHEWEEPEKWAVLESAFSRLTSPSLIEVRFQIHSIEGCMESITGLELVEKGLPLLSARGILSVEKIPGESTDFAALNATS